MQLYTTKQKEGNSAGKLLKQKYPETREEAIRAGLPKYWPGTMCPVCKDPVMIPAIYVKSGEYTCCVNHAAMAAYEEYAVRRNEPITAEEAMQRGYDYYWVPMSFPKCGHSGKHTLKGTCYQCKHERENSPRQLAIHEGLTWYTPDEPCAKGHMAPRRVSNGACQECERLKKPAAPELPFYKQHPDLIISFEDAKAAGLKVYRTGEKCKFGHAGWRYVSTRSCLTCMGR